MTANTISSSAVSSQFFSGEIGENKTIIFDVYEADKENFEKRCKEKGVNILNVRQSKFDLELFYYVVPRSVEDLEEVKETWGIRCPCGDCVAEHRYEWEW